MPLELIRNDITKMKADAIVNAANSSLMGGGGVDGAIHRAAGPSLLEECSRLGGCPTGQAKATGAGNLEARYVIHTVGPRWQGGNHGEKKLLEACYRNSLELARELGCRTIAFPLISSGIYGYPREQALQVAVDTISRFVLENDMKVFLVLFDRDSYAISQKLFSQIEAYIDEHYVKRQLRRDRRRNRLRQEAPSKAQTIQSSQPLLNFQVSQSLEEMLDQVEEGFSRTLLRKIDESGMSDVECYKKANVDRKLFSKIRSNPAYRPRKSTVLAFAIALELSLEETRDLLEKAGFALSHSSKSDLIIEFFIQNKNYNIFEINQALFAFNQKTLGV